MITLTKEAAEKVMELMEKAEDRKYLRVYVAGGGCSGLNYGMAFAEEKREGDTSFTSEGVPILVDDMSAGYIEGLEINWVDGLMGAGFAFSNPNAKAVCACGKSFCA